MSAAGLDSRTGWVGRAAEPTLDPRGAAGRERPFRPDIEGLRAVAVLLVVLDHAALGVRGGFVGVDVFFVISGFLITRYLLRERATTGRISCARFYARRARRIMPAAALVIVATTAASWAWLSPLRLRESAREGIWAALSLINLVLARDGTDYLRASGPPSVFQHYWSLAVEEQLYLVWPVLITLAAGLAGARSRGGRRAGDEAGRVRPRGADRAVVIALLAVAGGSFALSVIVTARSAPWAYFGGHTRIWEPAVGALVATGTASFGRLRPAVASPLSWLGLAGILTAAFLLDRGVPFPGVAAVLPVLATACVLAGGCAAPALGAELLLGRAPLRLLGRLSYSWYLWHWPMLQIWAQATGRPLALGQRAAAALASLLLAVVTYRLVERPARSRPVLVRRPLLGLGLGASCAAAVCVSSILAVALVSVPGGTAAGPARPLGDPASAAHVHDPAAAESVLRADLARASAESRFTGVTASPLTSLLARALRVDRLPPDLTPSLGTAQDDRQANRCLAMFAQTAPAGCVVGDPAGRTTVVLFGDSHASQWSAPLDTIGRERHWRVLLFAKADCPPAPYRDYIEDALGRPYTECDTWRADVLRTIARLRPNLVVVGSQARDRLAGRGPGVLAGLVRDLRATGAAVVFLRDTPFPGFNVLDCLARHPARISACAVSIAASRLASSARQIDNRGAREGGALLVDPAGWLCTADGCPLVVGNVLVYRDWSHLSDTYARLLAPYLGPALAAALHAGPSGPARAPVGLWPAAEPGHREWRILVGDLARGPA
ncbi:Acyltransferase 3 [Frankia canadensis]|uniref:Acyltransferase 3 n=1 Tax=Frankia canadensis TaxID=1836972 RepID=A0A2I2KZF4_9ACTN|nr:acyltransferase family protein [Frankia canadensis]SNQ51037.1 Acyltransferase 3 [Frankia canadensis]SOU58327.1 Acyltransferase 3 [Frankia canadensis]